MSKMSSFVFITDAPSLNISKQSFKDSKFYFSFISSIILLFISILFLLDNFNIISGSNVSSKWIWSSAFGILKHILLMMIYLPFRLLLFINNNFFHNCYKLFYNYQKIILLTLN